ncbi:hypothetical protein BGZ76_008679 [Entomortierella beljakovae]|nr:hypothetical protein BGZ76_008679 [Entomortierella beljakovae]
MLSILCIIDGKAASEAFSISISKDEEVHDFQKLIKKEKVKEFGNLKPESLLLWKVSIPVPNDEKSIVRVGDLDTKEHLQPEIRVSKAFPEGTPDNTISIVVAAPQLEAVTKQLSKKLDVYLKRNPNPTNRWVEWEANAETSTIQELRSIIQLRYSNAWTGRIVLALHHPIHPPSLHESLTSVSYPENDKDLRLIISLYIKYNVNDFVVDLEIPQVDFYEQTLSEASQLLGLSRLSDPSVDQLNPWDELIQSASLESDERKAALEQLYSQIQLHLDLSRPVFEETIEDIIKIFIYQASGLFRDQMMIHRNMRMIGLRGRGRVDLAITSKDKRSCYVCVTTSLLSDTARGVARNVLQLDSIPSRKRKASELETSENAATTAETCYGVVTDSEFWYFTKWEKSCDFAPSIHVSKLPVRINYMDDSWREQAKEVFSKLVWLMGKQSEQYTCNRSTSCKLNE